jgi:hypothetical protein
MATTAQIHEPRSGQRIRAPEPSNRPAPLWSRRQFLHALGGGAGAGLLMPTTLWLPARADADTGAIVGSTPLRLAMHVHGSWSEGLASWESRFVQAAAGGLDVLYLTDHDFRATATNYLTSLAGVVWVRSTSGSLAQQASTASGGSIRLLAESGSSIAAGSVTMEIQPKPMAFNRLRTSIAGQTLRQTVTSARLTGGARYEIVMPLSYHPARAGHPGGQYTLIYRFGTATAGRFTENGGLTAVVAAPTPAAGSVQVLDPEQDLAALCPGIIPADNAMYGLSFRVTSPRKGAVADIRVAGVTVQRTQSSPAAVTSQQARLISVLQPQFPALAARASIEVSRTLPDMNVFGLPQYFPDYPRLSTDHEVLYGQIVEQVHAGGGLISWNHPFGYSGGPLLSRPEQDAKRRALFAQMTAVHDFGVDLLEVGYTVRGNVDAASHLALWDTFSRNGIFLTGNGTSDDHAGRGWKGLANGFVTGVWASTRSEPDLMAALASGRAFAAHLGRWPGGELDLLVDGAIRMGSVSVSTAPTRSLAIQAARLPAGSQVQVVAGPVDCSAAPDPGSTVLASLDPAAFAGGTATLTVDTSTPRFYRAQVIAADGSVIGSSNPVWLLRQVPPGGIPAPRQS